MNNIENSEYWDKILEEEGLGNIDKGLFNEIEANKINVSGIIEEIDNIEGDIEVYDEDGLMKFYLDSLLIGVIEYTKVNNNEMYIDMIGNINADIEDFEKYDFKERYNFEKKDIEIKGLIYFMYNIFFEKLKVKGYKIAFGSIENNNLYYINEQLVNRGIIEKVYTRKNKYNKEELVREF